MDIRLFKILSETPSVPGNEDRLRNIVMDTIKPLVDTVEIDIMGNVIGLKKGHGQRKVMIAAHMDEIGFLVKYIDEEGFLRIQPLGGFDPRQLFAQRVFVHTTNESLHGVLSYTSKPTHMLTPDEIKQAPKLENFFVDLGMPADLVKEKVHVGDMVTMDRTFEPCGDTFIGKALDNRVGVFVMLEALKRLKKCEVNIYAVATVQEEIGLRGATTSAFAIEPDVGIALDTTLATDYPGPAKEDLVTELGKGAAIKIMDASLICHPKVVSHFRDIAEKEKIPFQMEILGRGGTDGGALQRSRSGAASMTLSIPTRYIHTVNEMVSRKDVEATIQLLVCYLEEAHTREYRF
ncbi:MAG: M20/M25/M40 family metallo-hydrolase [Kiritimatiellae bacterium]|nr:M20/M25/M40 family metallo-hydrolase [Kiritimatiellia bacterium]